MITEQDIPWVALLGGRRHPGFTPLSLLELLRRRGTHRPEGFARLQLTHPVDLPALETQWRRALDEAEAFVRARPAEEVGCLYYAASQQRFIQPEPGDDVVLHFGRPGGYCPRLLRSGADPQQLRCIF